MNLLVNIDLPKLDQEDISQLNRPEISNETDMTIKRIPAKKNPGPDSVTVEF
jgi:hypothetical protein